MSTFIHRAITHWKFTLFIFSFIALFIGLGTWQLKRAQQKEIILANFHARMTQSPLIATDLTATASPADKRFYRVTLTGHFDNAHTFLLDNKTFQRQIGYEIYTLFTAQGVVAPILVDRGFIPLGASRNHLPLIKPITGRVTITGMLNTPPAYAALGAMYEEKKPLTWPLRVQFIELKPLQTLLPQKENFYPYILLLTPQDPVIMGPEKHKGYAVQWFALALTLLILFVVLNRRSW